MSNPKIFNTATVNSNVDIGKTTTFNNLLKKGSETYHKSFDFSNIGIATGENTSNKHLRQFHQTRIYINDFDGMIHHNDRKGSTEATYLISANLPESIDYKIGSKWEAPLSAFGDAKFNALMQTIGNSVDNNLPSGINRATTMKIWGGTEPLSLSLKIPVIDDGYTYKSDATGVNTNLVEALEFLGSLCLPKLDSLYGFYTPPPSPLDIVIKYGEKSHQSLNFRPKHGRIMVQIGGILLIDNCIIKGVHVDYSNTKALIRHQYATGITPGQTGSTYLTPLLATVTIDITTIEALTAETYSHMLWLKHQKDQGVGVADIYGAINSASPGAAKIWAGTVNAIESAFTAGQEQVEQKLNI